MKNIILTVILLGIVLAGNAYAVGQNSNPGTVNQQNQVDNQGENTQIKTDDTVNSGGQVQQKTQQQLQDGTGDGNQVQNQQQVQNQVSNQEETKQVQNDSGVQRRSQVSNAVQEMIQVAERSGGIGEQIRTIAQAQNQNQIKLEESIEKVQKRSNLVKFIAGPDYREISNAEKILEQNREQIQQINQIKMQLENSADQQVLTEQVQLLEVANLEIENVLNNSQKEFSLLGWMFKLFKN
ncbi:MAG: hypothetical protein WC428_03880 [Candidatus Paceibacterota bacterium]